MVVIHNGVSPDEFFPDPREKTLALERTRLVAFDNPNRAPWDGMTARNEVFVRFEGQDVNETDETKKNMKQTAVAVPR